MSYSSYTVPSFVDLFSFIVKDDGTITVGFEVGDEGISFAPLGKFLDEICPCADVAEGGHDEER